MKIAYLVNQYPTPTLTYIRREIAALEDAGVEVERVSPRGGSPPFVDPGDRAEAERTRVVLRAGLANLLLAAARVALAEPRAFARAWRLAVRIGLRSDRGLGRNLAYLAEACVLLRWLTDWQTEHLHAHFATNGAAVAMLCRVLGGPPYSFTVHGPDDLERAPRLALDEKIKRASFVAAISDFARGQVLRWCDYDDWPRIHVIRCGVDPAVLGATRSAVPETLRFVCVGRLCPNKGQMLLIDAAARLAAEVHGFELLLIGDGPLRAAIEARIRALGLQERVRLTGWASGVEVRRYVSGARALVLPSLAEGVAVAAMEALALGRPVICTDVGAMAELVEHGVHGWVVRPGSLDDLVGAMRDAARTSTAKLTEMGRRGAERVADRHDASVEAGKLLDLFRRAVREADPGTRETQLLHVEFPNERVAGNR